MISVFFIFVFICWVICGVLAYGLSFAYFQRNWPSIAEQEYYSDMLFSIFIGVLGPIGLLSVILNDEDTCGFKFK